MKGQTIKTIKQQTKQEVPSITENTPLYMIKFKRERIFYYYITL